MTPAIDPGPHWSDDVSVPALLRAAHTTYGQALRRALEADGFDDVPPNGAFVLAGLARSRAPLADIVAALGTSKQAAGKLVDILVARGYLDRSADPDDRRRVNVALTDRGTAAADVIRGAADGVDAALVDAVGEDAVRTARRVLAALIDQQEPREPAG